VIGKGSFGSVYLVRRLADNKIYALKTVILDKLNKKEQENSVNEVRILASIHSQFVIGYKEAFLDESSNALNIVMEYADDGDLQTKIRKMRQEGGFFKESLIWEYALQMIKGLKALHDKKIMHRDLKSANIFLFKKNHLCKLGDMNVSKVIKDKVLLTQTGTPYYASPEVWRDESYSYKSDLWSIGCVIYELCEQHPPFLGKNLDELFEEVCRGKPKRINRIYSDDLWKMIMMLLQTDVNKRADCDSFLNSKLIKDKIKEMDMKQKLHLNEKNERENNDNSGRLLNTIKFDNIKDLKQQLPSTKNYENIVLNENKENMNINSNKIKIKNTLVKKIPIIKNKTSRNKLIIKTEEINNEQNKKKK
jgi:NIMA (never in mitosis gene a)-related kinase